MDRKNDISEMTVVVTGATSGIGFATAEKLAEQGAFVIGIGRSEARCEQAMKKIREKSPHARIRYLITDLSSLRQVRKLSERIHLLINEMGKDSIDVLVNSAGTFSGWYISTEEGFELQFAVNHLAPFLLTYALLPMLQNAKSGKVITVSSGSHYHTRIRWKDVFMRKHYQCLAAYKQTKLANVLFSFEMNRRLGSSSTVRAFAVDPGLVNTDIGSKGTSGIAKWIWERRKKKGKSPDIPASAIVWMIGNDAIQKSNEVYWKDCRPKAPSRYAQREDISARFWELTEKMCGVKWFE